MSLFANRTVAPAQTAAPAFQQTAAPAFQQTAPYQAPAQAAPAQAVNWDSNKPRPAAPAHIYEGVENFKDDRRNYIDGVGEYILEVVKVSDGVMPEGTKNANAPFFGADFKIVQSTNPEFPQGSEGSYITTLGRHSKYFKQDVNGFFCALFNRQPHEITASTIKEAVSPENPAAGMQVGLRVILDPKGGVNQKTGRPYTRKIFVALPAA